MTKFAVLTLALFFGSYAQADLVTVPFVDVSKYVGRWYQISHNPMVFEGECACSIQDLGVQSSGKLDVVNSCRNKTISGDLRTISGSATNDDPSTNARFTVDFGLPWKGQYWIIGLDPQYRFAVVSEPKGKALYILSKTPTLEPALYDQALLEAARQVDTSKLEMTTQQGCTYP